MHDILPTSLETLKALTRGLVCFAVPSPQVESAWKAGQARRRQLQLRQPLCEANQCSSWVCMLGSIRGRPTAPKPPIQKATVRWQPAWRPATLAAHRARLLAVARVATLACMRVDEAARLQACDLRSESDHPTPYGAPGFEGTCSAHRSAEQRRAASVTAQRSAALPTRSSTLWPSGGPGCVSRGGGCTGPAPSESVRLRVASLALLALPADGTRAGRRHGGHEPPVRPAAGERPDPLGRRAGGRRPRALLRCLGPQGPKGGISAAIEARVADESVLYLQSGHGQALPASRAHAPLVARTILGNPRGLRPLTSSLVNCSRRASPTARVAISRTREAPSWGFGPGGGFRPLGLGWDGDGLPPAAAAAAAGPGPADRAPLVSVPRPCRLLRSAARPLSLSLSLSPSSPRCGAPARTAFKSRRTESRPRGLPPTRGSDSDSWHAAGSGAPQRPHHALSKRTAGNAARSVRPAGGQAAGPAREVFRVSPRGRFSESARARVHPRARTRCAARARRTGAVGAKGTPGGRARAAVPQRAGALWRAAAARPGSHGAGAAGDGLSLDSPGPSPQPMTNRV